MYNRALEVYKSIEWEDPELLSPISEKKLIFKSRRGHLVSFLNYADKNIIYWVLNLIELAIENDCSEIVLILPASEIKKAKVFLKDYDVKVTLLKAHRIYQILEYLNSTPKNEFEEIKEMYQILFEKKYGFLDYVSVSKPYYKLKDVRKMAFEEKVIETDPDFFIQYLLESYQSWVNEKLYLYFSIESNGKEYALFSLASKRGNEKFMKRQFARLLRFNRLLKRLPDSFFPDIEFPYSHVLLITLTLDREIFTRFAEVCRDLSMKLDTDKNLEKLLADKRLFRIMRELVKRYDFKNFALAWFVIGYLIDIFVKRLEREFKTKFFIYRGTFELHEDLYPHVHIILISFDRPFKCFLHYSEKEQKWIWRVEEKHRIDKCWGFGFVDVRSADNIKDLTKYIIKYTIKPLNRKTDKLHLKLIVPFNWLFRKHSFTFRRLSLLEKFVEMQLQKREKRLDLSKQNSTHEKADEKLDESNEQHEEAGSHTDRPPPAGSESEKYIEDVGDVDVGLFDIRIELVGFVVFESLNESVKLPDTICLPANHRFVLEVREVLLI